MMTIKIFGACCAKCTKMYEDALEIVQEKGMDAKVEKVNDVRVQMQYGIMSLPALVIDEKLIASGRALSKKELETYICK